jgi:quercetin dioxygenase-like cupin family protein/DNA-binding Xre family transcriptional regulator
MTQKTTETKNPIGQRLAQLRREKKLSLKELSEMTGLKLRDLETIEAGNVFPPVGDILKISRALTVDPDSLLGASAIAPEELKRQRIADFNKRAASYLYTILTPEAVNKHLRAFRITIPPRAEHPKISYQHEGEEFVYVLDGTVEITVGRKKHTLKQNGALHFNSGVKHALRNPGKRECILIVAVYTP